MKNIKTIAAVLAFGLFATMSFGQIKVVAPDGDVGIGTSTPTEKLEVAGGDIKSEGLVIQNTQSGSASFERVGFSAFAIGAGVRGGFKVDQDFDLEFRSGSRASVLDRQISTGTLLMRVKGNNGNVGIGLGAPSEKLHVDGNIQAGTMFYASDKRLKENIEKFNYGLDEVLQLNTKTFDYHTINKGSDDHVNVGIIAQELEKIAPELVSTFTYEQEDQEGNVVSSEEYLRINDTAIKWMLVNAIQDQQDVIADQNDKINDLDDKIERLEALIENGLSNTTTSTVNLEGTAYSLQQNEPNPFDEETVIKYELPNTFQNASIRVYDMNGRIMEEIKVNTPGKGELILNAGQLASGTYSYSLFVDGQQMEVKKMILTK